MNVTKFLPNNITSKFARQILVAQKHSPQVLFGVGVVSGITSTVLACRATLKLDEVLAESEGKEAKAKSCLENENIPYDVSDYNKDMAIIKVRSVARVVALYGPAIGTGALAVSCFAGGQVVLNKRNVGLTAAYAGLDKGFKEYRERVQKELGLDKELELRYGTEDVEVADEAGKTTTVKKVSRNAGRSQYARFFDEYTKNFQKIPEYNKIFITTQQNYANDLLKARGHLLLNDVYDMLGMDRSTAGCVVGWVIGNGDNFVDFGLYENNEAARDFINGREACVLLDFNVDGVIYDLI